MEGRGRAWKPHLHQPIHRRRRRVRLEDVGEAETESERRWEKVRAGGGRAWNGMERHEKGADASP